MRCNFSARRSTPSVAGETGNVGFVSTTAKFGSNARHPGGHAAQLDVSGRRTRAARGQRLVALTQARAQPAAIASRVFPRIVFGSTHPYGRVVTEDSLKAISRDDIVAFHKAYYQPGRALITVVGDTTSAAAKPVIEKALGAWPKGGERPAFNYPTVAQPRATTIFLVDKPGAAQSTFAIGRPGPPRSTPDYYALQVMNTILGGMFQSRLNANIREEKGYSYGVNSSFRVRQRTGCLSCRRRHRDGEERCCARRVHEGASRHLGTPPDHR